ncbi:MULTISPECIES: hypothetical protein [unclassified Mesorhizobium]|uniref:hypothetical protein n=1 Tax=unclassified Mesorhizobium TaxID=325217 RepID=UPI000FE85C37|nr:MULTISPECIES: hypothetical protein [unclassified Mesorhizobium]MDG4855250.1 hypothetical protein [Mesorhizobium sp. WSM4982]MDG4913821.1 hypothetical protein [Mesorhizobium sp. WSM4983]RWI93413.1 MAG: hypothetical protein EOR22_15260 [Mesorhizobium sp.]
MELRLPLIVAPERRAGMTISSLHLLKGIGYSISTVSVMLLAIVSWEHVSQNPLLIACLLGGAATSIIGMFCRWLSYEVEKRQQERQAENGQLSNRRPAASPLPPAPELRDQHRDQAAEDDPSDDLAVRHARLR